MGDRLPGFRAELYSPETDDTGGQRRQLREWFLDAAGELETEDRLRSPFPGILWSISRDMLSSLEWFYDDDLSHASLGGLLPSGPAQATKIALDHLRQFNLAHTWVARHALATALEFRQKQPEQLKWYHPFRSTVHPVDSNLSIPGPTKTTKADALAYFEREWTRLEESAGEFLRHDQIQGPKSTTRVFIDPGRPDAGERVDPLLHLKWLALSEVQELSGAAIARVYKRRMPDPVSPRAVTKQLNRLRPLVFGDRNM